MAIMKILIGLPCSGKTTYRKKLKGFETISRDDFREELIEKNENLVSEMFNKKLLNAFLNNKNIIIDNTNLKRKYRKVFINEAIKNNYELEIIIFDLKKEDLLSNSKKRNFDFNIIEKMNKKYEKFKITEILNYKFSMEVFYNND